MKILDVCGIACFASVTTSCVPFVLPPVRLSGAGGVLAAHTESSAQAYGSFRAGLHPLQLAKPRFPMDVGVGYGIEGGPARHRSDMPEREERRLVQSLYIEAASYPSSIQVGPTTTLRWGGSGAFDLLFHDISGPKGYGFRLGPTLEVAGYANQRFSSSFGRSVIFGFAIGQWAVGASFAAEHRSLEGTSWWGGTVGINVRVPVVFGATCCRSPRHHRKPSR